ncbi:GPI-anchored surface protein, putative [Bodo saltans]|uniref:GPI-anchored surface protein, putative n=1 Tax=Bodo saltans TaxID=75058 RepID=A0A0S4JPY5_BODSA|nr:GPI-anchored surface protein, putative [Bodo saltans]|eukprot:CUG92201.1 GPI-anchored surface protein, putative [Bodo saltans]
MRGVLLLPPVSFLDRREVFFFVFARRCAAARCAYILDAVDPRRLHSALYHSPSHNHITLYSDDAGHHSFNNPICLFATIILVDEDLCF